MVLISIKNLQRQLSRSHRIVVTAIDILRLVSGQSLNVNTLIERTTTDRTHVIEVISLLVKSQLIEKKEIPSHKKMRIIRATSSGDEIFQYFESAESCKKSISRIIRLAADNLKKHKRVLDVSELDLQKFTLDAIVTFQSILLKRYLLLLAKYYVSINGEPMTLILGSIYLELVKKSIETLVGKFLELYSSRNTDRIEFEEKLEYLTLGKFLDIYLDKKGFSNNNLITDLLICLTELNTPVIRLQK